MDLLEFRKVFDFIEYEMPSTQLNDGELKQVYEQYTEWLGKNLHIHIVSKRLPSDEEIEEAAKTHENKVSAGNAGIYINEDFIEGASWMLKKYLVINENSSNTKLDNAC